MGQGESKQRSQSLPIRTQRKLSFRATDAHFAVLTGQTPHTSLTLLDRGLEISLEDVESISQLLAVNTNIKKLTVPGHALGDDGIRYVAEALKVNSSLEEIKIGWNQITAAGIRHVADALKINRTLLRLSLDGNNIGIEGANYIAEALRTNDTLLELNLRHNQLQDEGARYIAEAMCTNTSIILLDLDENLISADGAHHIADCLKKNSTLERLFVHNNSFGDAGAMHFADALQYNCTLRELSMGHSVKSLGYTEEASLAIVKAIAANPNTALFEISGVILSRYNHILQIPDEHKWANNRDILAWLRRSSSRSGESSQSDEHCQLTLPSDSEPQTQPTE